MSNAGTDDATPEAVDLDEARRIEAAMTPGPWSHRLWSMQSAPECDDRDPMAAIEAPSDGRAYHRDRPTYQIASVDEDGVYTERQEANARGIVHMRNTYEPLLAEVAALRASFASQAMVTVTARQAVSDVVVQRDAALAEVTRLRAALERSTFVAIDAIGCLRVLGQPEADELTAALAGQGEGLIDDWRRELAEARAALTTERRTVEELRVGLGEAADAVCSLRSATRADVERWRTLAGPQCPRCHGPLAGPTAITTPDGSRVEICGTCETARLRRANAREGEER